jgi:lipopolysaccharide/colanic/teichoic acid biosynthesis glycosyltransferase
MDIVALPTYREGFPNVPLEAAGMELPVVATNVPGCIDAVADGRTGLLVPPRDAPALASAIRKYLNDSNLRLAHGKAGRERVLRYFRQEAIWEALFSEYDELLSSRFNDRRKRIFDFVVAALGLLFLSPVMVFIGLGVWARLGRPILFMQDRPGYLGRPFVIYKFRTMVTATDECGDPLPDESRITPFGHFLRQTSLDELPELWNVLKGEMSLVGPRPLRMEYLPLYSSVQARRHEVRPGITGWAQINGRNATTWEKRLALDVWYVDHRTLRLDLSILLRTLLKVMLREGINQEGMATMEPFSGAAI